MLLACGSGLLLQHGTVGWLEVSEAVYALAQLSLPLRRRLGVKEQIGIVCSALSISLPAWSSQPHA